MAQYSLNGEKATQYPSEAEVFDERLSDVPAHYRGTAADVADMAMLGKKQVLRV